MDAKKLMKTLLFPHFAVLLILLPICTAGLVYSMLVLGETDPIRIAFYVLSFYTLTIWCVRVPKIVRRVRNFKKENRYMNRWFSDVRLRTNVTLSGNVMWNGAYSILQLGLGVYHKSAWFCSLSLYYASLALMRFFLVRYTLRNRPGEKKREEWQRYRICGWVFLVLNLALSGIMLYMITKNRVTRHHEITVIAISAYTFFTLTMAILNIFRYRKYNSPVISASRAVSLTAACVSMLTLEETMLATFGGADMTVQIRQSFLGLSGGAIFAFILVMAIYIIVNGNKQIKYTERENGR